MSVLVRWKQALPVAIEGAGVSAPLTVGAVALLFSRISPSLLAPGLLAALLGMAVMQIATARSGRPMVYAVRVLDVSMLLGFLDHFILKMPGWGLADTPAHRLLLVIAVSAGAALLLPLGYALRLQRFARMIPTPVFAGFSTALAVTVLISQGAVLFRSWPTDGVWFAVIAVIVLAGALLAQRFAQKLPPGVIGLVCGTVATVALAWTGVHSLGNIMHGRLVFDLPVFIVNWSDIWAPGVDTGEMLRDVVLASATLAVLVFLNTVVNEEAASQLDERHARPHDWMVATASRCVAVLMGSPMLSVSLGPTRAAVRAGVLDGRAMILVAVLSLAIIASGLFTLVPLAAVCGLLLFDAWNNVDRPSTRMSWQALRGRVLVLSEKEDLITIGLVVAAAVIFNMVVGVFIGVFAGLVLYAWRNGRRLARTVETGATVHSNCARSPRDMSLLGAHAQDVRFVALEGALFFGAASALQALMRSQGGPGHHIVVDWSHVVNVDSTVGTAFVRAVAEARAAGSFVAVSGLVAADRQVRDTLDASGMHVPVFPDADRGLEWAENEVIKANSHTLSLEGTALQDGLSLLQGLQPDQRKALEPLFEQRFFRRGETVFAAGQHDSELMLILQGSVDILVPHSGDRDVRLARIRRGAMLGELSFLDSSVRAATAVATEDVLLGVLSRERFEAFARDWPDAGRRVLSNLALDLAFRLRRTNHMAVNSLR